MSFTQYTPFNKDTASVQDRIAWALCQIIDDDAPMRWTRFRPVALCMANNPQMMVDLLTLGNQKLAIVIHEDRHADTEVHAYTDVAKAIERAEDLVKTYGRHPDNVENTLNGEMRRAGWIYHKTYSSESDSVRVQVVDLK